MVKTLVDVSIRFLKVQPFQIRLFFVCFGFAKTGIVINVVKMGTKK